MKYLASKTEILKNAEIERNTSFADRKEENNENK